VPQNSKIAQISTGGALQLLRMIPEIEFGACNPQISPQLLFSNRAMVVRSGESMPDSRMTDAERNQWMTILDAAVQRPGDEINEEWEWLLEKLDLPDEHFPAVLEAIRQGRWRTAKNPRAYVKTVARREAAKMGLLSEPADILELVNAPRNGEAFSMEATLDYYAELSDTAEAVKGADGIWRRGGGLDDLRYERYDEENPRAGVSFRGFLLSKVPQNLKQASEPSPAIKEATSQLNAETDDFHIHLTPSVQIDWGKWAELAGFDEWDRLVLQCRLLKISRDQAMAGQPDEDARKAIQAAWRKFDRNGVERLQEAQEKFSQKNVPELRFAHTR
jgi:hypothetical protein